MHCIPCDCAGCSMCMCVVCVCRWCGNEFRCWAPTSPMNNVIRIRVSVNYVIHIQTDKTCSNILQFHIQPRHLIAKEFYITHFFSLYSIPNAMIYDACYTILHYFVCCRLFNCAALSPLSSLDFLPSIDEQMMMMMTLLLPL